MRYVPLTITLSGCALRNNGCALQTIAAQSKTMAAHYKQWLRTRNNGCALENTQWLRNQARTTPDTTTNKASTYSATWPPSCGKELINIFMRSHCMLIQKSHNLAREDLGYARKKRRQESDQEMFSLSTSTCTTM